MEIKEQKLQYNDMLKYIGEWYNICLPHFEFGDNGSDTVIFAVSDFNSGEVIFEQTLNLSEYSSKKSDEIDFQADKEEIEKNIKDNAIFSTKGILNEELRGLIEQCVALDKQLAESLARSSKQQGQNSTQFGL